MGDFSTIDSEGRVTLPETIRDLLCLKEGDRVEFVVEDERVVMRTARAGANPFERYFGILGPFPGGEEGIKAWIADMRDDDDDT